MRITVVGVGAVGTRAARHLASAAGTAALDLVDPDTSRVAAASRSFGDVAAAKTLDDALAVAPDVVVLATPEGHPGLAARALAAGAHVVSVADDPAAVEGLLELDDTARAAGRTLVVGAGFSPGLTCVLARHAASTFDEVDEVHVAKAGTGGPACARQHHRALAAETVDWKDGDWLRRPGGSGRELVWFPDPIGGVDCYRAGLPDARLLQPAFPVARRLTSRMAATRRDRLTSRLPMLRPPHKDDMGAVRVEVRGRQGSLRTVQILGALDRTAVAAGAVAATAAQWVVGGRVARVGAAGLAELVADPIPFLHDLDALGIRAAVFEGAAT